jgi:PAS domain S-box-containing protein
VNGQIIGVAGMSVDMTEQRAMEAALRASEERFRFALEAAGGVGTWDWDVAADCIHTSETFARLFGVDPNPADGAPISAYLAGIHPEDRERVTSEIQQALESGAEFSAEYRVISADQGVRWIAARGRCYHDAEGRPMRFPGIVIDITERKRTEEALAESQGRLQTILDTVPVGIVIAEAPSGRIIGGNPQVERIFGHPVLPSDTLENYREWIGYHPDGRRVEGSEYPLARALMGKEERPELEVLYQRGDGQKTWIRLIAAPVRDETGRIVAGVVACLDIDREKRAETALRELNGTLEQRIAQAISEREQAEAQLRQAQKMEAVGRLTGGVAHDFNNLLTVVMGNLDMLRRRAEDLADGRFIRSVDNALEGARRASQLTHRLLAFSRQSPLQPEILDLNKIVSGMSELLRRTIGENIAIETVLAGGLWRTEVDPNQLESAILNLAVNARDAMPNGGKLTIETSNAYLDEAYAASTNGELKPGQYVMVCVSDTGTGMAPDVKAKVFEPFFTTKPVGKGTGLGLAQVYGFARQSNGHAAVYSELGQGTTLKLYFPRVFQSSDRKQHVPIAEPLLAPVHSASGETVLVVEDEAMVRDFSVSVLEDAGYRVLAAEDGRTALALLDRHCNEIDLLFTDVVLTGSMNGRKVADEALKIRPDLKVLFTTGYTRNAIIHHGRLDEGVHLITKPFAAASLIERVRELLAKG